MEEPKQHPPIQIYLDLRGAKELAKSVLEKRAEEKGLDPKEQELAHEQRQEDRDDMERSYPAHGHKPGH